MAWRVIPTRLVPMWHRMETDVFRHHKDMMSQFWRSFDHAWKDVDKEMDRAWCRARRFDRSDGIRHVRSPYVTDAAGNKKMQVRYDVSSYKPEDITVKMVDNKLVVNVKQMREEAGEKWYSEFTREFEIPKEVEKSELKSTLTSDGILQVEAPLNAEMAAPKETEIPIEFTKEGAKEGAKSEN